MLKTMPLIHSSTSFPLCYPLSSCISPHRLCLSISHSFFFISFVLFTRSTFLYYGKRNFLSHKKRTLTILFFSYQSFPKNSMCSSLFFIQTFFFILTVVLSWFLLISLALSHIEQYPLLLPIHLVYEPILNFLDRKTYSFDCLVYPR